MGSALIFAFLIGMMATRVVRHSQSAGGANLITDETGNFISDELGNNFEATT